MRAPAWFRQRYPAPAVPETAHPRILLPNVMTRRFAENLAAICRVARATVWSRAFVLGGVSSTITGGNTNPTTLCMSTSAIGHSRPLRPCYGLLQQFDLLNPRRSSRTKAQSRCPQLYQPTRVDRCLRHQRGDANRLRCGCREDHLEYILVDRGGGGLGTGPRATRGPMMAKLVFLPIADRISSGSLTAKTAPAAPAAMLIVTERRRGSTSPSTATRCTN